MKKLLFLFLFIGVTLYLIKDLPESKKISNNVKLAYSDFFDSSIEKIVSEASENDVKIIIDKIYKEKNNIVFPELSDSNKLLDIQTQDKKITYIVDIDYDEILNTDKFKDNENLLLSHINDMMISHTCSKGLSNYLVKNKSIIFEYKYIDFNIEKMDIILVEENDCDKWENSNYSYTLTKMILKKYNELKSII
ncbi:MAG: hypothetical protein GY932_04890 [Arcobacter sp.]|nr:hypothetical protein [Arcobacter sp.]